MCTQTVRDMHLDKESRNVSLKSTNYNTCNTCWLKSYKILTGPAGSIKLIVCLFSYQKYASQFVITLTLP